MLRGTLARFLCLAFRPLSHGKVDAMRPVAFAWVFLRFPPSTRRANALRTDVSCRDEGRRRHGERRSAALGASVRCGVGDGMGRWCECPKKLSSRVFEIAVLVLGLEVVL